MARLIDADALSNRLEDLDDWCRDSRKTGIEQARCMVHESPTVDAVSIVRCKDCVNYEAQRNWYTGENYSFGYCYHWDYEAGMSPNQVDDVDFCSFGERRSQNNINT
jgi:hypothetical protein